MIGRIVRLFYLKPPAQANGNRGIPLKRGKKAEIKFLSNLPIKVMKLSNVLNKAAKGGAKARSRRRRLSYARMLVVTIKED
jgi:hypothetical protein